MIIKNAEVYTENGCFEKQDIYIRDGMFCKKEELDEVETVIDGTDCYLIPGLTDIHFHGCVGYDFSDATEVAVEAIAVYEASQGVTTMVPATMTYKEEHLLKIAKVAKEYENKKGAILCGINMEGPFISRKKKGAQNEGYICAPDEAMFERIQKASDGLIKILDLAPEVEGAMEFICNKKGQVVLSMAHTDADYDTAKLALKNGVSHVTHLFNAMNSIHHREPGPVIAAAEDENCNVELICDGVHVHPAMVRSTLKLFGKERVIFISDSIRATGLEDGVYDLGGQKVSVNGKLATLADGTIAGSASNLMQCVISAVKDMGVPLETAVECAAVNPAKSVGIYDKYGSISVGKVANAVLLRKEDLSIKQVVLKGELYDRA